MNVVVQESMSDTVSQATAQNTTQTIVNKAKEGRPTEWQLIRHTGVELSIPCESEDEESVVSKCKTREEREERKYWWDVEKFRDREKKRRKRLERRGREGGTHRMNRVILREEAVKRRARARRRRRAKQIRMRGVRKRS